MKKKKRSIVPILVGLVVALAMLIFSIVAVCVIRNKSGNSSATENPTVSITEIPPDTTSVNDIEIPTDDIYNVVFYGPDDRILLVAEVKSGEAVTPPENPVMPQGYVFSHWDKDFSCVTEDLSVYAVCQEIDGQENVLALSGGTVQVGDEIVIPLQLCGNVNLCAFDIRIDYNGDMLEFVEFRNNDGAVDANCVEGIGEICLNFASVENTQGEVYLAELVFRAVGKQGETSVGINVNELIAYDADYNFYEPPYITISGKVTIVEP